MNDTAYALYECAKNSGLLAALEPYGKNIRVTLPISNVLCEKRISELNLSVRSINGLMRAGVDTVDKLINVIMTEQGIASVRNLGRKSVSEIKTLLLVLAYGELNDRERMDFWCNVVRNNILPEEIKTLGVNHA